MPSLQSSGVWWPRRRYPDGRKMFFLPRIEIGRLVAARQNTFDCRDNRSSGKQNLRAGAGDVARKALTS